MNVNATFRYGQLNTKYLKVDTDYQRVPDPKRVKTIAEHFNPLKVNPIKVSHRDNAYWIFDGQHTTMVLKLRNGNQDLMVDCKIYEGLTKQDEAELFARQSEFVRKPEKNAELKALYVTGDPEIIELKNTLESLGFIFDFSKGQANYKVVCCSTVYKIFSNTRISEFIKLMSMIKECWHGDKESLRKEIISGLWIFLNTYTGEINLNLASSKLSKISPVDIIRDGKTHREMSGDTKYAWIIATAYNKGNRSNKVDVSKLTMKMP